MSYLRKMKNKKLKFEIKILRESDIRFFCTGLSGVPGCLQSVAMLQNCRIIAVKTNKKTVIRFNIIDLRPYQRNI